MDVCNLNEFMSMKYNTEDFTDVPDWTPSDIKMTILESQILLFFKMYDPDLIDTY